MAYKVRKFSQIREFEEWMDSNGHTIDNATTMVYGCHIVITYKLSDESLAKAIEGRVKVGPSTTPVQDQLLAMNKAAVGVFTAPAPELAPELAPKQTPVVRPVIQARASTTRG